LVYTEFFTLISIDYRCLICGPNSEILSFFHLTGRKANLDLDHTTGLIRGILCTKCNLMLGHSDDDISKFNRAAIYKHFQGNYTAFVKDNVGIPQPQFIPNLGENLLIPIPEVSMPVVDNTEAVRSPDMLAVPLSYNPEQFFTISSIDWLYPQ